MSRLIGHVSLGVLDLDRSAAFYDAVMGALGWARVFTSDACLGYGRDGLEPLNLFLQPPGTVVAAGPGFHLAFDAPNRGAVAAFHAAALAHGGTDAGAPGLRAHYGPTYFAAFVHDPDDHKLEVVHQVR